MAIPYSDRIIKTLSYVFGFAMKKYYTTQRLADMVKVTVPSEHSGISINCADLPYASAWLEFTNLSPFPVVIYGIEAELNLSGRVARFISFSNHEVAPSTQDRLFIQTDITEAQANHIKRCRDIERPRLVVKMWLGCRLRNFEIFGRQITTKNV